MLDDKDIDVIYNPVGLTTYPLSSAVGHLCAILATEWPAL